MNLHLAETEEASHRDLEVVKMQLEGVDYIDLRRTPPDELPTRVALPVVVTICLVIWAAVWFSLGWIVRATL